MQIMLETYQYRCCGDLRVSVFQSLPSIKGDPFSTCSEDRDSANDLPTPNSSVAVPAIPTKPPAINTPPISATKKNIKNKNTNLIHMVKTSYTTIYFLNSQSNTQH